MKSLVRHLKKLDKFVVLSEDCLLYTSPRVTVSPDGMNLKYQHKIGLLWKPYVLKGRRSRNLP